MEYSLGISLSHNNNQTINALISGKKIFFLSVCLHVGPQIRTKLVFQHGNCSSEEGRVQVKRTAMSSLKKSYSEAAELLETLQAKKLRNSDPNCSGHMVSAWLFKAAVQKH